MVADNILIRQDSMKLRLPFPPVNHYRYALNDGDIRAKEREYQSSVAASVIEQLRRLPKPTEELLAVQVSLFPPDWRRRDADNCIKALFDALTHAHVWKGDNQVMRVLVKFGPIVKKGKVEITISKFVSVNHRMKGMRCTV